MGPNLIFDKSFLQSLNPDEAVWLDMFFSTVITPVFYIETLADLEKSVCGGRTPEQVVGNLAYKTPDMYAFPNMHHRDLLLGELLGHQNIDMRYGRPVVGGGRSVSLDGQNGVVFQQPPETEALNRWHKGEFLDLERQQAKDWRRGLTLLSVEQQRSAFAGWFGNNRPTSLAEVKSFTQKYIDSSDARRTLSYGLSLVGVHPEAQAKVLARWESAGSPQLGDFAPYFHHIFSVELFFYLALAADLLSRRPTNAIDLAYTYYLPFCMVFVSSDDLHRQVVPLFLKSHQSFVWGWDLKKDLSAVDQHYSAFSDEAKARGLHSFASWPPGDASFLVTQLWDKHMRPDWRELASKPNEAVGKPADPALLSKMRRATKAAQSNSTSPEPSVDDPDYMITTHYILKSKGKWNRFPPEVDERRPNGKV